MSRAIWRRGGAGMGSKYDMPPYIYDEVNDEFTDTATGQKFSKNSGTPVELEDNKAVTITTNGETVIEPTEGKDAMKKVTATVAVPVKEEQTKSVNITTNGETVVEPDNGKTLSSVTIVTAVEGGSVLDTNVAETIDVSQYTEPVVINPTSGKDGMIKATVTLSNIPSGGDIEANKAATIDVSQYTEPVEVTPTSGKDGMEKVTVTLSNIPSGGDIESNKAATIDVSQYTEPVEIEPTSGKNGMAKATVTLTNIPDAGSIDTTKWKVYGGTILSAGGSSVPASFLVDNIISATGVYDVYVATGDTDLTSPASLVHISGETWTYAYDGCENYTAEYTDSNTNTTYCMNWIAS